VIASELAQTLVVTAVALGAIGFIVRRAVLRKKKQLQAPGCSNCAASDARPRQAARPSRG
jgi:hypothetical protein